MKKIIGIFLLIAGIVVAVGASSANFAYFEASRDVHINVVPDDLELIDLEPMQPYAYLNSNGELVIKLNEHNSNWQDGFGKGVSPDSIYAFEEVFGVSNHLWEEDMDICVTVSYSGGEGVSFFTGNYTGEGDDTLTFTVPHGGVVPVGMIINSTGLANGTSINGNLEITAIAGPCQG